jgi:hypothetical protein
MFVRHDTTTNLTDAAYYARVNGADLASTRGDDPYREYFEQLAARPVQGFGGIACVDPAPAPRRPHDPRRVPRRRYRVQART